LDIPTDLKDWWIYLIPGDLLLIEILFLYDVITKLKPAFFGPRFEMTDIWSYSEAQIALVLLLIISVGLVAGSLLEGLSSRIFAERFQKKSTLILAAFQEVKTQNEDFTKQLLSDPDLFPAEFWKGSFDAMEKNIGSSAEFIEKELLHKAKDDEAESLDETAVAITFTQSFFLSFIFFPFIIFWMFVGEFVGVAFIFCMFYVTFLVYLWKDQQKLTKIYWTKTFDIFLGHLWMKKSEKPVLANITGSQKKPRDKDERYKVD